MDKKFFAWVYKNISSRPALMIMLTVVMFVSVPIMLSIVDFLTLYWGADPPQNKIIELQETTDGIATIFVMLGVFLESRETLFNIVNKHLGSTQEALEHKLNKLSINYGVGFLINGLLMEIGTAYLNIPDHIINSNGHEKGVFIFCFIMSMFCMYSLFSLFNKYIQSYFFYKEML